MAMATSERDLTRFDDARLVGLAQNGHQEAFAELYDRYRRPLFIGETSHFGAGR